MKATSRRCMCIWMYPAKRARRWDFLIQEMNREANTIGSKCSDAQMAQNVVNLKSEIEKMREQIQNAV